MDHDLQLAFTNPLSAASSQFPPRPLPKSYWVTPQLLACEYPGGKDTKETSVRLKALLDAGIREFFDLTTLNELLPYDTALREITGEQGMKFYGEDSEGHPLLVAEHSTKLSSRTPKAGLPQAEPNRTTSDSCADDTLNNQDAVRYRRFPIKTPTPEIAQKLMEALLQVAKFSKKKAIVHCWAGIGRTGTIAVCYLIASGQAADADEALELWATRWRGIHPEEAFATFFLGTMPQIRRKASPQSKPKHGIWRLFSRKKSAAPSPGKKA